MPYSVKGFVLEKPRVGVANSPFTSGPDDFVSDSGAFTAAYPASESVPGTEYCVLLTTGGDLKDARFSWTKNEVLERFGYDGRAGRFWPLPGGVPDLLGALAPTSNTTRLKASVPVVGVAPYRLTVGALGLGTSFSVVLVGDDAHFTDPGSLSTGTVELSRSSGNLNWATSDLGTYNGAPVYFQGQNFKAFSEQKALGLVDGLLYLNPIPATGTHPLIRISSGLWMTAIEKANESAFSPNPFAGTVEWARDTGRLKLNSTDISNGAGKSVYYDGVLLSLALSLPQQNLGTIGFLGSISPMPPSGGDLVFYIPGVVQFPETVWVTAFDPVGKVGQVQVKASGQVQFSAADQVTYSGQDIWVVIGDLVIERGVSVRFFRTPIDPGATDPTHNDLVSVYTVTGATLMNPIVSAPQVPLPSIPIDSSGYPIVVRVTTKSGTVSLPRLDVLSPPTGEGFVLDISNHVLDYAVRQSGKVVPVTGASFQLPDPLVLPLGISLAREHVPGSGTFFPLTLGTDVLLDSTSGIATLIGIEGTTKASGSGASFSGDHFTDLSKDFYALGILRGDILIVGSRVYYALYVDSTHVLKMDASGGTATGLSYEILHGKDVLVDRQLLDVPVIDPTFVVEQVRSLGMTSNSPRLSIPLSYISISRFRFGMVWGDTPTLVTNDGAFSAPSSMVPGHVEISRTTGNLNFSLSDVTLALTVYCARQMTQGVEYTVLPETGFINFTDRMLGMDELLITYIPEGSSVPVQERGSFIVRKELVLPHLNPTNTLSFNPTGKSVAPTPAPAVFRGGRPQTVGRQVVVNEISSTVTFQPDDQVTNTFPHGAIIAPTENVYIDYFIYEAMGGEKSTSTLQAPVSFFSLIINGGDSAFTVPGDLTRYFQADNFLLVDGDGYYINTSIYYPGYGTVVYLYPYQAFRQTYYSPRLQVVSAPIPITGLDSYWVGDMVNFGKIPRGSSSFLLPGDQTETFAANVALIFIIVGASWDGYWISSSAYSADTNLTTVTLLTSTVREYTYGSNSIYRTMRAIGSGGTTYHTSALPVLTNPFAVYKKPLGDVGAVLNQGTDFTINDAGKVELVVAPGLLDEIAIFYTARQFVATGIRAQASYTAIALPDPSWVGGLLEADYSIYSPDNFYYRVESLTDLRAEMAEEMKASAQGPSGGPATSNSGAQKTSASGRGSPFFTEGRLINEDVVARPTLKWYNDTVNFLEDYLQWLDGRVVGGTDGRFLFDGSITNPPRANFSDATNQIDDLVKVSDAPYTVTGPPWVATSVGTYLAAYLASNYSRFYSTYVRAKGVTAHGIKTGDTILDVGFKNLASVTNIRRRSPWAVTTKAALASDSTIYVDKANGDAAWLRPAFATSMKVAIQAPNGTFLVADASPLTVSGHTGTSIGFSTPIGVAIPAGSTVLLSSKDTVYRKFYQVGKDVGVDLKNGLLTFIKAFPPLDGSDPSVPASMLVQEVPVGEVLSLDVYVASPSNTPTRAPVFDGGLGDDDNEMQLPVQGPLLTGEYDGIGSGALEQEAQTTVAVVAATTEIVTLTGSLDPTKTTITAIFGSPTPQVYDLVRITDGLNGLTAFRRVASVGAGFITVDVAFAFQDSGFHFQYTGGSVASGAATFHSTTILDDAGASFLSTVMVGQTVIMETGGNASLHRQVTAILSNTQLQFTPAVPGLFAGNYRIGNSIATFGPYTTSGCLLNTLEGIVGTLEGATSTGETIAADGAFNQVLDDLATGSSGTTVLPSTFNDLSADFLAAGVIAGSILFITTAGLVVGFYQVASVTDAHNLVISGTFASAVGGLSYRVCSSFGVSLPSLRKICRVKRENLAFRVLTLPYEVLLTTPAPVVNAGGTDLETFATNLNFDAMTARGAVVSARQTQVPTEITDLSSVLASVDKLYDARFSWVDFRINMDTGGVSKKNQAATTRVREAQKSTDQIKRAVTMAPKQTPPTGPDTGSSCT